jgi:hypothetical protein
VTFITHNTKANKKCSCEKVYNFSLDARSAPIRACVFFCLLTTSRQGRIPIRDNGMICGDCLDSRSLRLATDASQTCPCQFSCCTRSAGDSNPPAADSFGRDAVLRSPVSVCGVCRLTALMRLVVSAKESLTIPDLYFFTIVILRLNPNLSRK